mgnify:CR=1 FL=1
MAERTNLILPLTRYNAFARGNYEINDFQQLACQFSTSSRRGRFDDVTGGRGFTAPGRQTSRHEPQPMQRSAMM